MVKFDERPSRADLAQIESALAAAGYATVWPEQQELPLQGSIAAHRHTALMCLGADYREKAVAWLRRITQASPRRHLVLVDGRRQQIQDRDAGSVDRDVANVLQMLQHARFIETTAFARSVSLRHDLGWHSYAALACAWADAEVELGRLPVARDRLHSLAAERALREAAPTADVRRLKAELRFWLGNSDLPELGGAAGPDVDELGWSALAAWKERRVSTMAAARARLELRERSDDEDARFWIALTRCLGSKTRPSDIAALQRWALGPGSPSRRRALAAVTRARGWTPSSHARVSLSGSRSPLAGVEKPVSDTAQMPTADELTTILRVFENAPDEGAALSGGCGWLQRLGDNTAVAIVSSDGQKLVAACGWKPADLRGEILAVRQGTRCGIVAPIRYGGRELGFVVARCGGGDSARIQRSAETLAVVCGSALRSRLDAIALREHEQDCAPDIVGRSAAIADLRASIARAAATAFPVLIEGESGTGKELVARALHRLSPRRDRRFVAVNCAALTDELVEAELFGHTRGAFTGAIGARTGLFEEASGGTLFLDEVTELSARAQAKLLRALQEQEVRRVGENAARRVDVRVVAATNVAMHEAVLSGRFRHDLRYRLAVVSVRLPALRDRLEDLPLLTHLFWRRAMADTGKRAVLGADVLASLGRHHWPGNIRELQNVLSGLAVVAPAHGRVTRRHVNQVLTEVSQPADAAIVSLESARLEVERRLIATALARHAGRRSAAAHELGLTRQGLTKAMRRLGLMSVEQTAGVA